MDSEKKTLVEQTLHHLRHQADQMMDTTRIKRVEAEQTLPLLEAESAEWDATHPQIKAVRQQLNDWIKQIRSLLKPINRHPLMWQRMHLWRYWAVTWRHPNALRLRWHNLQRRWRYLRLFIYRHREAITNMITVLVVMGAIVWLFTNFETLLQSLGFGSG